jgi:predicted dehydrogenase
VELRRRRTALTLEVLGPEYSLNMNSLDSGLKLFMSREVKGAAGEDLVEKQNCRTGLMPVLGNEAAEYGYEAQDRYFVQCFLDGKQPERASYDGLEITELLMTAYMSAEQERTIHFKPDGLETYVPLVAQDCGTGSKRCVNICLRLVRRRSNSTAGGTHEP